jgi:hypothetical protein
MVLVPSGYFVGHGADFNQEGAQSLADKVKILQQTYGNTNNTDHHNIIEILFQV